MIFGGKTKGKMHRVRTPTLSKLGRAKAKRNINRSSHGLLIHLQRAMQLPSADSNGFSDPFVKFKLNNRNVGRSSIQKRTLNPVWEEEFFTRVTDFQQTLKLEVWDYDRGTFNDYLGEVEVSLDEFFGSSLYPTGMDEDSEKSVNFEMTLRNKKTKQDAGLICFSIRKCRHTPKKKDKWTLTQSDAIAKQLIVDLVSGRDLIVMDRNGKSDPFCILKFQDARARSKVVRYTTNPKFQHRFDFAFTKNEDAVDSDDNDLARVDARQAYKDGHLLEIDVYDYNSLGKRETMGQAVVDVSELEDLNGGANEVWAKVLLRGQPAGVLLLYLTVMDVQENHRLSQLQQRSHKGLVRVIIFQVVKQKAKGTKKVCFVEAQVGKHKLRTQPVEDRVDPVFNRELEIPINDIFANLELTLVEKKYDAWEEEATQVGKLIVPILSFYSAQDTHPQWVWLKEEGFKKASNAQIRFAAQLRYNPSPFTFFQLIKRHDTNPLDTREQASMAIMKHQIARVTYYRKQLLDGIKFAFGLLNWDYGFRNSILGMTLWFFFCLLYRPWFLPLLGFGLLMYTRTHPEYYYGEPLMVNKEGEIIEDTHHIEFLDETVENMAEDDEEDDALGIIEVQNSSVSMNTREGNLVSPKEKDSNNFKLKKKAKTTLREKLSVSVKVLTIVQQTAESIADYYERILGVFIWRNPNLTWLLSVFLLCATLVLMFVPLYLILIVAVEWQFVKRGLRKYGLAFIRPEYRIPFHPLDHFLHKVPTLEQCKRYARVRLDNETCELLEEKTFVEPNMTREKQFFKS